jgi:Tol biopolymer transport system component
VNRFAVGVLILAVFAVAASYAGAASPEGPRLAIVAQHYGQEVITTGPRGENPLQIVDPKHAESGALPSSSADGSRLAFTADVYPDDDPVLGVVDADGANLYSPDGSSFAFVRWKPWSATGAKEEASSVGELRVGSVGAPVGSRLLVRMRGRLTAPSWDPSGQRLAFVNSLDEDPGDRGLEDGNRVMAINADGSCLTKVFSNPDFTVYGAAWQPGPGREAGLIAC